jgi:hypothetical protein
MEFSYTPIYPVTDFAETPFARLSVIYISKNA